MSHKDFAETDPEFRVRSIHFTTESDEQTLQMIARLKQDAIEVEGGSGFFPFTELPCVWPIEAGQKAFEELEAFFVRTSKQKLGLMMLDTYLQCW